MQNDLNDSNLCAAFFPSPNELAVHSMQFVFLSEQIAVTTYSLPSFIYVHLFVNALRKQANPVPPALRLLRTAAVTVAIFHFF